MFRSFPLLHRVRPVFAAGSRQCHKRLRRADPWTEWMVSPPPSVPKIYCWREIQTFPERRNQTDATAEPQTSRCSLALFLPHPKDPLVLSRCRTMLPRDLSSAENVHTRGIHMYRRFCIRTIMMNNITPVMNTRGVMKHRLFPSHVSDDSCHFAA